MSTPSPSRTPPPTWAGTQTARETANQIVLGFLAVLPLLTLAFDEPFYLELFSRVMVYAIAALSLDLILGYGGMVSFGHAAFLGVGAYTVGILSYYGIDSAFLQWPAAILLSALAALVIGYVSLRTTGVYFIMITLAFAQMLFYFFTSLEAYGGDDGLTIWTLSEFFGPISLDDDLTLYYVIFAVLGGCLYLSHRLVHSRFGRVLQGIKSNEARMRAIGYPTKRYKLLAFVISGTMCGLAGVLLANQAEFVAPSYLAWHRSGELIVMVLLGGMGTLFGPVIGAVAFMLLAHFLADLTIYWPVIFGPFLIAVVLFGRGGLYGLIGKMGGRNG
ncbi:MAG: branched-chain amino acid ABC transporter permease [Rhodospirillaceae bacterium]|jgi:branched-chain amino acid transport system permease protein|nr:branched-chain amino acid ABC transporter permease [Rhodospirillaceae bacterium]MBT6116462.1 branched-chain amino acid ABC transporter permease [Rhodospirillaceae bacterium]